MSTITVAIKDGYAAIAADSLSKAGERKATAEFVINHQKIFTVGENYLAITGPTSAKLAVTHHFSSLSGEVSLNSVQTIYRAWLHLHEELKNKFFLQPDNDEDIFESSCMNALIANPHGIFGVTADRMVHEFARFYAYGSGGTYAMGAMQMIYHDLAKSAEDIARIGIETACTFDAGSGEPIYSYAVKLSDARVVS